MFVLAAVPDMPYCPNCGHEVDETDRFCIECGQNLEAAGTGQSRESEPRRGDTAPARAGGQTGARAPMTRGIGWIPVGIAVISLLQSLYFVLSPEGVIELGGFGDEITTDAIVFIGALGILSALAVVGLVVYYYRKGFVGRRYFWGLVVLGVVGFFFGGGATFLGLVLVGAYGLFSILS